MAKSGYLYFQTQVIKKQKNNLGDLNTFLKEKMLILNLVRIHYKQITLL